MIWEYEFSKDFMQDVANILELCKENKTDSITIALDVGENVLIVDMSFRIK